MNHGKTVDIGVQSFEKIRARNSFYVDKTELIREWWENGSDATLITRPRRFGKTLNMSMLECFFSNKYAGRNDLFEGLSIWEDRPQGKYDMYWADCNSNGLVNSLIQRGNANVKQNIELLADGIVPENIRKYGFAFRGKECLIQGGEK